MHTPLTGVAALNEKLIGVLGSRGRLETPAAVLDLDIFERNIARLAETCGKFGIAIRPHAKSHKCAEIARRQIAAGALGVCCAKSGELLALYNAGIQSLMLSAPVASAVKIDALAAVAAAGCKLTVVVDRGDLISAYGAAARSKGATIDVLIDLDVGLKRSGVSEPAQAVALARAVTEEKGLRYAGVQAYQGRVQHIDSFSQRESANRNMEAQLMTFLDLLRTESLAPIIISGGGTGSHFLDGKSRLFTEVQAGSYVFMDEGYNTVDIDGSGQTVFGPALRVAVTVVGHSSAGFAITDGGSKSFALDGPAPHVFRDGKSVGRIEWCGDEFGRVLPTENQPTMPIGTVLECTVPHCDPTINLHDVIHIVSGDTLKEYWAVEGRGRSD